MKRRNGLGDEHQSMVRGDVEGLKEGNGEVSSTDHVVTGLLVRSWSCNALWPGLVQPGAQ